VAPVVHLHKTCYKPEHGMLYKKMYMRCWEYPYKNDWL